MEPNTRKVKYGVEVTGDQFDHERFREVIADMGGAEIVAAMDEKAYFQVTDTDDDTNDNDNDN